MTAPRQSDPREPRVSERLGMLLALIPAAMTVLLLIVNVLSNR